jgi:two-component system chemotaxis response regulator CheY
MATQPTQPTQPGTHATGQAVLVVEDDDAIRETIVYYLRDAGYTVYEAPDGKPALQRLHSATVRMVVLLDLNMPGMDGMELLRAVAAHDVLATRHTYLLMTATNARTLPLAFVNLLTQLQVTVLAKPFGTVALLQAVAQAAARLAS